MDVLPHELRITLKTLAFLGMAKPGQKCFMEQERFVDPLRWNDPSTWVLWWTRRMSSENVASNLTRIEKALDDGIAALAKYPTHTDLIKTYLSRADGGLAALEATYESAPGVVASLSILREQIRLLLGKGDEEQGEAGDAESC